MRYILLLLLLTLYISVISGLSFLIFPYYGELWGLGISVLSVLLALLLGDKFILAIVNAKVAENDSKVARIFQNFSFQQGLLVGNLMTSSTLKNNIFVIDNLYSKQFSVVVGENLEKSLSDSELKSMIFGALDDTSNYNAKVNLILVEILFLCYIPLVIFQKFFMKKLKFLYPIISFIFFPLQGFQNLIFTKKEYFNKDILFENLTNLSSIEFESGLLKLKEHSAFEGQVNIIHRLIYNLTIARNRFDSFLDVLLFVDSKKR